MKIYLSILLFFINFYLISGQTSTPKLVVGIVVDQMRFDQLYKYQAHFSEDGFKRLIREGYNFKNTHYNYIPTVTAAGHASIYTGTTPSNHGIIGNSWYDRKSKNEIGNVVDLSMRITGSKEENAEGKSPHHLLANTVSDQLRTGSNFQSKVISVSLKDRGAILPGGHTANAAYWHDYQSSPGYFVSSSYYMNELPEWVDEFNNQGYPDQLLDTVWNTLLPIEEYDESDADNSKYENILTGNLTPSFPYDLRIMKAAYSRRSNEYQLLWLTPMGNTLLTNFAKEAIVKEALGAGKQTDMLCISYSVPDVAGHTFGPQSVEIQDIYLRLDLDIANLLSFLDDKIGENEYVLFLTSDHAAIPNVAFLEDHKMPAGLAHISSYESALSEHLKQNFQKQEWIEYFGAEQVYLNHELIKTRKQDLRLMQQSAADFLSTLEGIKTAVTASQLLDNEYSMGIKGKLQRGFYIKRSGDILLSYEPGFIPSGSEENKVQDIKGTVHGSGHAYDTHVPLLWFGKDIPHGETMREVHITDIAPTLALILNLQLPNSTSGKPLVELEK